MAARKAKRSVRRAQPAHRPNRHPEPGSSFELAPDKIFRFPEAKGKVVEGVEFVTSADYNAVSLGFRDKTCLNLTIEPGFSVQADYLDPERWRLSRAQTMPLLHAAHSRKP